MIQLMDSMFQLYYPFLLLETIRLTQSHSDKNKLLKTLCVCVCIDRATRRDMHMLLQHIMTIDVPFEKDEIQVKLPGKRIFYWKLFDTQYSVNQSCKDRPERARSIVQLYNLIVGR